MSSCFLAPKKRRLPCAASILRHTDQPADLIARVERFVREMPERSDAKPRTELMDLLPKITADFRNLKVAWDWLSRNGGRAPGPNGITYTDVPSQKIWPLLRDIAARLSDCSYRPGPVRPVQVPKSSGIGSRTLTIANIEDRLVHRSAMQIASPLLDETFLPDSFGGRPGRSPWMVLARALPLIEQGRTLLISQDIRDAFDNVPWAASWMF
jgi:RNA-directed DNA polymerase